MNHLFVLSNVGILAGYLFMGLFVAPRYLGLRPGTKVGGVAFFLLCGLTHYRLAAGALAPGGHDGHRMSTDPLDFWVHVLQFPAVWVFVLGLYIDRGHWGALTSSAGPAGR